MASCTRSLYEAYRYLGNREEAARHLGFHIIVLEADADENLLWYRRQLEIVTSGEPLHRLIGVLGTRRLELDELPRAISDAKGAAKVTFVPQRNRPTIAASRRLTVSGRQLAEQAKHVGALDAFAEAAAIDPFDPDPHYNAGVVLIELGQYRDAGERFALTESLAPGWFYCRRYRWLSDRLAAGALDPRVAAALIRTGDAPGEPAQWLRLLEPAVKLAPELTWPWMNLAKAQAATGRRSEAIGSLRRGLLADADDDVRSSALVDLGMLVGPGSPEGRDLLGRALALRGNLLAAAWASISLWRT